MTPPKLPVHMEHRKLTPDDRNLFQHEILTYAPNGSEALIRLGLTNQGNLWVHILRNSTDVEIGLDTQNRPANPEILLVAADFRPGVFVFNDKGGVITVVDYYGREGVAPARATLKAIYPHAPWVTITETEYYQPDHFFGTPQAIYNYALNKLRTT